MYQEKQIIVDSIVVSYRISGNVSQGLIDVFLHGWESNKESFSSIQKDFQPSIAIDMPGFGNTKSPEDLVHWDVLRYRDFVHLLFQALGIAERVALVVGHSFGGRVAAELQAKYPTSMQGLVLTGTPMIPNQKRKLHRTLPLVRILKYFPGGMLVRRHYYKYILGVEDYINAEQSGKKELFGRVIAHNTIDVIPQVTVPILLLWGAQDETIALADAYHAQKVSSNAQVVAIENAKHFAFVDRPVEYSQALIQWKENTLDLLQ